MKFDLKGNFDTDFSRRKVATTLTMLLLALEQGKPPAILGIFFFSYCFGDIASSHQ